MSDDQTKEGGLERLLHVLCDLSAAFGCVILVAMAGMTVVSVVGRAFFEHPILGDVELVQLGCAVVVAAFLPYAQFKRANIIVDFFTTRASAHSTGPRNISARPATPLLPENSTDAADQPPASKAVT